MNLYQKIRHFLYFRKKGLTDYAVFKMPLTDGDKYALILIMCVVIACIICWQADEIDRQAIAIQQADQKHAVALHNARVLAKHNEDIVVSMYNGSVIENGKIKTVCILNSAGDCE